MATSLYQTIQGITVSSNEILEAELLAQQILQAQFPDLDLREGTGLRDLVIRPNAMLLAMVNKAIAYYFSQNTISGIDDNSPSEILDAIMSNWFLNRNQGSLAIINARLYFARQKNISLTSDVFFSPDNTLKYYPLTSTVFNASALYFDAYSNEYYMDVDLIAGGDGNQYNISAGSLLYFTNFDPYFLRAEINYLRESAVPPETNTQFMQRAQTAISTRNLINTPSVISNLRNYFPTLSIVLPIGFSDPEMIRDVIQVTTPESTTPVILHQGGCIDVFCNSSISNSILQFTTDASGRISVTGPVYQISRSSIPPSGDIGDTIPLTVSKNITSLTSSGTTATATVTAHGYASGTMVTIANAVPSGYNGTFPITVVDANRFTFTVLSGLTSPATIASGQTSITATINTPFTVTNPNTFVNIVSSLSATNGTVTATLANHKFMLGRMVTISGASPSWFNGNFVITYTDQNTFQFQVSNTSTANASGSIAATAVTPTYDVGFSDNQTLYIDFGAAYANQTASFQLSYFSDIDNIQTYLEDPLNRVLCANILARAFNVYFLDVTITSYIGSAPDSTVCTTAVNSYLNSLKPGQIFVMSDCLAALASAGITGIQTPITINYNYFTRDLLSPVSGVVKDYIDPNDRTAIFMLNSLNTAANILSSTVNGVEVVY